MRHVLISGAGVVGRPDHREPHRGARSPAGARV